ncbi:MAG: carbon-nitrogen hydrolase family protein, partial [Alphaproteobacteria bacterium]
MSESFRVACVQNCAEREMAPSIAAVSELVRAAAQDGAQFIALPEMATMLEPVEAAVLEKAKREEDDPG